MAAEAHGGAPPGLAPQEVDPRTGLALIDVPLEHRAQFAQLAGTVMHYFASVTMVTRKNAAAAREQRHDRWLLVTDSAAFILKSPTMINRSVTVSSVVEVVLAGDDDLVLSLPDGPLRYDLWVTLPPGDRGRVVALLDAVYAFHTQRRLPHRDLGHDPAALYAVAQVTTPSGWKLEVTEEVDGMLQKDALFQKLREDQAAYTEEQAVIDGEFQRIRSHLQEDVARHTQQQHEDFGQFKREYQRLQDAHNNLVVQFDVMAQDVDAYVKLLNEKDREIEQYKRGDHPKVQRLVHELETTKLKREVEDEKRRGQASQELQEVRAIKQQQAALQEQHAVETRRQAEEIQRLTALVNRRDGELRAADAAIQERNGLLQAKQAEIQQRDVKLSERDRELRYTKLLMRDTFRRQVEELDAIRGQFQHYDDQMVSFIQRMVAGHGAGGDTGAIPRPASRGGLSPPPPAHMPPEKPATLLPESPDPAHLDWLTSMQQQHTQQTASPSPYRGQPPARP
eukprot:TRINITY_DN16753_c0_g1_i1.p1 TRINITY_DN16753_c0_g1~~TRINITY_DN16753_c0_g1_i1.p1  ORF type:complete len:508 (+),score=207.09 TRINITY_DN16753_c0_g1_i1:114-1637(+)